MLRALVASVGVLLIGAAGTATAAPCGGFTDVDDANPAYAPFCDSVEWMKLRSITLGLTPTLYDPNSPVTRLQMAAFMYRRGFQNAFLRDGNAFGTTAVLGTTDNQPLDIRVNDARVMRYEPSPISPNVIGGSPANSVTPGVRGATIAGGGVPLGDSDPVFFVEAPNRVTDAYGTIAGGYANRAGDDAGSTTDQPWATIGGGIANTASGLMSTVSGGDRNTASGGWSTVVGGDRNTASGFWSTVVGGRTNRASGSFSLAAGDAAEATAVGEFVWSDASGFIFNPATIAGGWPDATNTFNVRATGGFWFISGIDMAGTPTAACAMQPGVGAWNCSSSRDTKTDFNRTDVRDVLDRVVALPIETWRFKGEDGNVRHMGPMAQDFRAAFGLGHDDTTISSVDTPGVALAAIQGLNAKLEAERAAKNAEIAALRAELGAIRSQLATIEARSMQAAEVGR